MPWNPPPIKRGPSGRELPAHTSCCETVLPVWTAHVSPLPFNSASRPGTPPTSGGPRPARESGWRWTGMRGRPCPAARPARSADAAAYWPEGSARFRPVALFRRSTGRGGMFLACGMHQRALMRIVVTVLVLLLVSSCGGGGGSQEEQAQNDTSTTGDEDRHLDLNIGTTEEEADDASQDLTSVVAEVSHAPIPFAGSDGRTHLVYELETTNFSSGQTTIEQLEVLDGNTGDVVDTLDTEEVTSRLQPAGLREAADALAPSMMTNVFLHVPFDEAGEVPDRLVHRLSLQAEAAPPDQQQTTEEVGPTEVERRNVVVVGPPLKGSNYSGSRLVLRLGPSQAGYAPDQRADHTRTALRRRLRAARRRQPRL